uniref:replication initiation protein RepC n=1 Tax=Acidiphilium angustum TaxID=523 RepID=UPI001FE1EC60
RYGRRDARGRIVEGYGFDLSPIGARLEEFRAVAEAYRAERASIARLRRRATIARNSLRQTWQTYHEQRIEDPARPGLRAAAEAASAGLRGVDAADALTVAVERLETVAATVREALEMAHAHGASASSDSVEMSGRPDKNVRHITHTTENLNTTDTVIAKGCSFEKVGAPVQNTVARTDRGSVMKIRPDELIRIAPRLKLYLWRASPSWPEIEDVANWLRHDLGISKPLWDDAYATMDREHAAIAVAIVSAKPIEHFRTTPGGISVEWSQKRGMVRCTWIVQYGVLKLAALVVQQTRISLNDIGYLSDIRYITDIC